MLPAALHTIAFLLSLFVQTLVSPLAGAWLFFHLCGCVALIYNKKYPANRSALWSAIAAWLLTIGLSAFIIHPVLKGAATMWILIAMPSLALCLRREHIKPYLWGFGSVIFLFACGLIVQMATHTQLDPAGGTRYGWPLLDPNNAAAVINLALIPCIWLALKDHRWWPVAAIFGLAMYATGSKAGMSAAMIASLILGISQYGVRVLLFGILSAAVTLVPVFIYRPEIIVTACHAMQDRFPIWWCGWLVLKENYLRGLGLGTFGMFRIQQGLELYIPPTYAHNDLLQFAVEMGLPAALVFCFVVFAAAFSTRRTNLVSGVAMLAVFLGAMVEFQLYIPSVSLAMGLALAFHLHQRRHA